MLRSAQDKIQTCLPAGKSSDPDEDLEASGLALISVVLFCLYKKEPKKYTANDVRPLADALIKLSCYC
jgi:hypothetical protein